MDDDPKVSDQDSDVDDVNMGNDGSGTPTNPNINRTAKAAPKMKSAPKAKAKQTSNATAKTKAKAKAKSKASAPKSKARAAAAKAPVIKPNHLQALMQAAKARKTSRRPTRRVRDRAWSTFSDETILPMACVAGSQNKETAPVVPGNSTKLK